MKNALQQIIASEVNRHYKSEAVFYREVLGISQPSWNRYKNGEHTLRAEKMSSIKSMFTPYEWMLANKVASDMNVYPNNFKKAPYDVYTDCKVSIAKQWAPNAKMSVNSIGNDLREHYQEPGTTFLVKIENSIPILNSDDYLKFYLDVPSHQVPAGKRNRLEWFEENFEDSII